MKTAAIISEYNPFHLGHKYQVNRLRADGFDVIIAIMSGSVVQRGELACADKFSRGRAAIACGVDIVIELPAPFSCSSAEYFAYAGVFAAEMLHADVLSFGSECGDLDALRKHSYLQNTASAGSGAARAELEGTEFLSNDILGIEYLRAIRKLKARIEPLTHKREGGGYLSQDSDTLFPSASAIRKLVFEKDLAKISACMPRESYDVLLPELLTADKHKRDEVMFDMLCAKLSFSSSDSLSHLAFLSGGLAQRLKNAAEHASSLEELYSLAATKVYTNGRIRRASICALCEIEAEAIKKAPEYLAALAASRAGRKYLSDNSFDVEICSNVRQKKAYSSFEYEKKLDTLYSLVHLKETGKRENYLIKAPYMHQS